MLDEVRAGRYGHAINYTHSFSFTFSTDFPLATVWPERLDPPSISGGGELTNLGCYAVDYMIGLWGRPKSIQAKSTSYWDVYREAGVENFGQVIADYGDFFAVLASGKQPLQGHASMDVTEALNPRNWHNVLEMQFEHHNVTVLPFHELLIHNGAPISSEEYLSGYAYVTPFQQLLRAIETGQAPDSNVESARLGVEVLMAAYESAREGGKSVALAGFLITYRLEAERGDHLAGVGDPAELHREVAQGRRVQVGREARDGVRDDRGRVSAVERLAGDLLHADLRDGAGDDERLNAQHLQSRIEVRSRGSLRTRTCR